ncbi:outer membrane protein assembly factor BamA [Corticibacter populi]|uniref:Outer membrane protein assembly factor BamA n=1 Tax=Corticibacter populi TaxID=1550736 RepID=A0A3M6QRF1_9BURK|nr:outer membrane protein assembly factor BamA [Corticibacter populi]RMX05620.1 outer membrane protein assembly factor BamA [Corticibacter populi]RZS31108.1 Beta-barrel assembly machine subunit BamA [Corticibacter populi]
MNHNFRRFWVRTLTAVAPLALSLHAWALEPFTVRDIRVEGLQRVEAGTVFASLPIRVGDLYTDDKGSDSIRSLFALGLFNDVRIEADGNVMVVVVQERPVIANVEFAGAREFDRDALLTAMRDIGLAEGRPYDKALADRAEQELVRQYLSRSYYGAQVVTTITPTERNRVNLTFTVTEGSVAKIGEIRFTGNKEFSESTLRGLMDQDTGGWLSWYTKSDRYSRAKLNADLEAVRSYYLQRGFIDFRIDSTQVAISPDKQSISITVNVHEGDRFAVSAVRLDGNYLDRDDEFKALVRIKPGEPYNENQVTETTQAFSEHFGNYGYAFARVEAVPDIDRANHTVAVVLRAVPQRRVYVRRIAVTGNTKTRDEVIRREFRQFEASWYDGEKIRLSRDRVDRLGYFTEVDIETQDVPGAPDQVDLQVAVVEKPTGSLQLGAGFSSAEKLSFSFGLQQENFMGTGHYMGIDLNTSKYRRTLVFNTTDPYFTQSGVSRAVDLYYRTDKPYEDMGGNYSLVTMGGALRFGVPFSETDTVYFGLGAERNRIKPGTNIPAAYLYYADRFGYTSNSFPFTIGWSRDSRDSALAPNEGRYQRFSSEWSFAGDTRYLKTNYQYQQYVPLGKKYTLAFNGELGWGKGFDDRPYPVFKNFYSGGLGSVRGFDQGTLGPRDLTGASLGGSKKVTLNAEFMTPFPGAGNDRTLRLFAFVDAGNVFGEDEKVRFSEFRASTGLGLSWISPLGPLRLAYAHPVRKKAGDRIEEIQFQIGTSF